MNKVTSQLIDLALLEDIGSGDVTSEYFVSGEKQTSAYIYAKADGVLAGMEVAMEVFKRVDTELKITPLMRDGEVLSYGDHVLEVEGSAQSVLTAERTVLNFMQRLSGIASKTSEYVTLVKETKAKLLDTRKTTPGWRVLEKAAVVSGGGENHRMGLYDRAMVKDNHLAAQSELGELQKAIQKMRSEHAGVEVELEADTLEQVKGFLSLDGVDYILLDNMTNEQMREAVSMRDAIDGCECKLEASGGVTMKTIAGIAKTGVDYISVGALTHSAVALDLSLEFR